MRVIQEDVKIRHNFCSGSGDELNTGVNQQEMILRFEVVPYDWCICE